MIDSIKRILTINKKDLYFKRVFNAIVRRIANIPHLIYFYWPIGFPRKNREHIKTLKGKHKDERCFIIANGPSLNKIDFTKLKSEWTIGMNRIYLLEKVNGFTPNYLAVIDGEIQIKQFNQEYDQLEIPCFYNFNYRKWLSKRKNQFFLKAKFGPAFSKDISNVTLGSGLSVTYTCMQIAFYLGFSEVYLIGKDHHFNTNKAAHVEIESDGKEENHFIKGYYKPGQKWVSPDHQGEEIAYKIARKTFENGNKIIKDATIGGKLDVFEKVNFNDLFD